MIKIYSWIILLPLGIFAQENALRNIAPSHRECYDNRYLLEKDNRLPHTLNTLIAIIDKIENTPGLDLDLRKLTVSIMHSFRQDGIVKNPTVSRQEGISPYAANIDQTSKYLQILRVIPEKDTEFSYDITDIEKCTLHFMLSSSIEMFERDDKDTECRHADSAYRRPRSVNSNHSANANFNIHDVETLTPEQIDVITNRKDGVTEDAVDPNALYPELPPNHPRNARVLALPPLSGCPVENGVVKTNWGAVSAGSLIAGIAAGLQPEMVKLSELLLDKSKEKPSWSRLLLNNKWLATLAGDLAEVAVIQGPTITTNEKLSVGVNGNWNSSFLPRWYFLSANEKLQFTTAEIRGGLDGLIIADIIESLYSKIPTLKLSQILDLYYSAHGLFDLSIRACNRNTLFTAVAQNSTMSAQAYIAALLLMESLQRATIDDHKLERLAVQAVNELSTYIPSSMNKDLSCQETERGHLNDVINFSVDLTIILDTTWPFDLIQPMLANLLDNMKINRYNSHFTIINGYDGSTVINATSTILNFNTFNITNYKNITNGFDFAKSLEKLYSLETQKLDDERSGLGGAKSNVVLIIPYTSTVSDPDKELCIEQLKRMREQVPDATILILTYGSKDRWSDFVSNPATDLFSTTISNPEGTSSTIFNLISRIKKVPKRLINTQCGANYSPVGSTNSFIDYIEPTTSISYKMHPNYFFSTDTSHESTIKFEGSGWGELKVCTSQRPININSTEETGVLCKSINSDVHTIKFSCSEPSLIHLCQSLYVSVIANSSTISYQCISPQDCRFPHMIKYTISYENLVCVSSATTNLLNTIVLIVSMLYVFL